MEKKQIGLRIDIDLLEEVEKYQKENRFNSLSQAIVYLLFKALSETKEK